MLTNQPKDMTAMTFYFCGLMLIHCSRMLRLAVNLKDCLKAAQCVASLVTRAKTPGAHLVNFEDLCHFR